MRCRIRLAKPGISLTTTRKQSSSVTTSLETNHHRVDQNQNRSSRNRLNLLTFTKLNRKIPMTLVKRKRKRRQPKKRINKMSAKTVLPMMMMAQIPYSHTSQSARHQESEMLTSPPRPNQREVQDSLQETCNDYWGAQATPSPWPRLLTV